MSLPYFSIFLLDTKEESVKLRAAWFLLLVSWLFDLAGRTCPRSQVAGCLVPIVGVLAL
jgi:hypothetical protein